VGHPVEYSSDMIHYINHKNQIKDKARTMQ